MQNAEASSAPRVSFALRIEIEFKKDRVEGVVPRNPYRRFDGVGTPHPNREAFDAPAQCGSYEAIIVRKKNCWHSVASSAACQLCQG
jgi:hypothetical protein